MGMYEFPIVIRRLTYSTTTILFFKEVNLVTFFANLTALSALAFDFTLTYISTRPLPSVSTLSAVALTSLSVANAALILGVITESPNFVDTGSTSAAILVIGSYKSVNNISDLIDFFLIAPNLVVNDFL